MPRRPEGSHHLLNIFLRILGSLCLDLCKFALTLSPFFSHLPHNAAQFDARSWHYPHKCALDAPRLSKMTTVIWRIYFAIFKLRQGSIQFIWKTFQFICYKTKRIRFENQKNAKYDSLTLIATCVDKENIMNGRPSVRLGWFISWLFGYANNIKIQRCRYSRPLKEIRGDRRMMPIQGES